MLKAINKAAMVINKKVSKIKNFLFCTLRFFSLKFFGTVFVSSIISYVITESSILPTYLPF